VTSTYKLDSALGATSEDIESKWASEGHSHTGERASKRHRKKVREQGALTVWRGHWEGQIRIRKESEQARGTHFLKSAPGATSEDREKSE